MKRRDDVIFMHLIYSLIEVKLYYFADEMKRRRDFYASYPTGKLFIHVCFNDTMFQDLTLNDQVVFVAILLL